MKREDGTPIGRWGTREKKPVFRAPAGKRVGREPWIGKHVNEKPNQQGTSESGTPVDDPGRRQMEKESGLRRKWPRIRNKDGVVVWQPDAANRLCAYSWTLEGGAVVVKDGEGNTVEGYLMRPGETVEAATP